MSQDEYESAIKRGQDRLARLGKIIDDTGIAPLSTKLIHMPAPADATKPEPQSETDMSPPAHAAPRKTLTQALDGLDAEKASHAAWMLANADHVQQTRDGWQREVDRIAELSQLERRAVYGAAGLQHLSSASAPLETVQGGGSMTPAPVFKPIAWEYWRDMLIVDLWQAVALSLDQNPEGLPLDRPTDEHRRRMDICLSHVDAGRLVLHEHYPANRRVSKVGIARFREWAISLGLTLPAEFPGKAAPSGALSMPGPMHSREIAQTSPVAGVATVAHTIKPQRRDSLDPVLDAAQRACRDPDDAAEVWAVLQKLAEQKAAPLIGATEEGLQYLSGGAAKTLTRNAVSQRIKRRAERQ